MKTYLGENKFPHTLKYAFVCAFLVAVGAFGVTKIMAQSIPPPVLTITPTNNNQMVISITNGVNYAVYDLYTTPVLANAAYPWTVAAIGSAGQTNFTLNFGPYTTSFYRVLVDTNSIPLWAAADPNNPGAGYLSVFIDSPTNGSNLTQ